MDERETKMLMDDVAAVMKSLVSTAMSPIIARMDAIERRFDALPAPKDADEDAIAARVRSGLAADIAEVKAAVEAIVIPEPPALPDIPAMIAEAVGEARAADTAQVRAWMDGVEERLAALPTPLDGKDADPEATRQMVEEAVTAAVSALPSAEPGKSVTVDDVAPMLAELVDKAVRAIPVPKDGKDGVGIKELLIDRVGDLVATMTDGDVRRIGQVVGKDADMPALEKMAREMIEALPKPRDGLDGIGFDDMAASYDGERTVTLRFEKGDRAKEFAFNMPIVLDRGVFKEGAEYKAGDGVTWGRHFWIAQRDTADKPEPGSGWRLAVKSGRDGKDGVLKAEKPKTPLRVG